METLFWYVTWGFSAIAGWILAEVTYDAVKAWRSR